MVLAAALLACGCNGDRGEVVPPVPPPPSQTVISAPPPVTGPVDPADRQEAIEGNTAFALDLYAKLAADKEFAGKNLFFSPYSISSALAMTYAGARGNTAEQLRKTLRFAVDDTGLHGALAQLTDRMNEGDPAKRGYELVVANALWGQKGYRFLDPFVELSRACYRAGLNEVDFKADPEGARGTINAWVEKQTREKIKELIPPGGVDALTRLALVNAVYFKGAWAKPFGKGSTQDRPFRTSGGASVNVPSMYQEGYFKFLREADLEALELPYAGEALSMVALLPRKVDGLPELEKQLAAGKLGGWLKALAAQRETGLEVYLPRFVTTSSFSLGKTLLAMGTVDAFRPGAADFSGMNGKRPPDAEALHIGLVLHKAFVDVNEEGTEAAAATAVLPRPANGGGPPRFKADHPFVFLIRDNRSGSILFLGRVVNPKA